MIIPDSTIVIPLTQGQYALIDSVDADLANLKWYAAKHGNRYYARHNYRIPKTGYGYFMLHRLILERKIGRSFLPGDYCDHININTLDNRRDNLRIANSAENTRNRRRPKSNTSGFKGVSWDGRFHKSWHAQIQVNYVTIHLGFFNTPEEAHEAYKKAAAEHFGEFARFE